MILTDPWFEGPCQQTWWNFPPLDADLFGRGQGAETRLSLYQPPASRPSAPPVPQAHFDRATPGDHRQDEHPQPGLGAEKAEGFSNLLPFAFETRTALPGAGCDIVLFRDFHGNTAGDDSVLEYDLDTSLYLFDADGARVFNAVDNTIRPEDAERIAAEYGAPDVAMLPYASASLYPMAMADYDDAQKTAARDRIRARTSANFAEVCRELKPGRVIPAGGEYVLGGSVADQSRASCPSRWRANCAPPWTRPASRRTPWSSSIPGTHWTAAPRSATRNPKAVMRGFSDDDRAAYALTLAGQPESYTGVALPPGLDFEWSRAMGKAARNYLERRRRLGLSIDMDVYIEAVSYPARERMFLFKFALDGEAFGMREALDEPQRKRLIYRIDERMLFCLLTGLVSWNAMEASALLQVQRQY